MASSAKNQSLKPFSENEGLFFILKDSHDNIKENACHFLWEILLFLILLF
jgi:hypothetical protein